MVLTMKSNTLYSAYMHWSIAISMCVWIRLVRRIRGRRPFTACSPGYAAAGHLLLQDLSTYVCMNMTCSPKYAATGRLQLDIRTLVLGRKLYWSAYACLLSIAQLVKWKKLAPTTTMYNLNTRMARTRRYRLIQTAWSCTHVHVWFPNHQVKWPGWSPSVLNLQPCTTPRSPARMCVRRFRIQITARRRH
jgi:hypothetical protein